MENESVSGEDRAKLEQVSGEIMNGVREIADILAANTNQKSGEPIQKFSISRGKTNMVEVTFGDGSTNSGLCYQDPPGMCCGRPCPCVPISMEEAK
jgi:hypothetical protein